MNPIPPIRPELLASKIEKIQNFEFPDLAEQFGKEPALLEALWLLQFMSQPANCPGGLSRFSLDLIESKSDKIGTAASIAARPQRGKYELADAVAIFSQLPRDIRRELFGNDTGLMENAYGVRSFSISEFLDDEPLPRQTSKSWNARLTNTLTPQAIREICMRSARKNLAQYFKELCELPHVGVREVDRFGEYGPPWYFVAVADALTEFIADRASAIRSRIADTEITQLVSQWIKKSQRTRRSVMLIGNSRFGKTEAIKMNVDAEPGLRRWVDTPPANALTDLLREIAKALGLEMALHTPIRELRERIEYVLRYSGLQLIFDEAQRLLPATFSRNTTPARIDWLRHAIMDRDLPAVFSCTEQSYLPAKKRFVNKTGFAMEQFDTRVWTVNLPNTLSESGAMLIARIHLDGARSEYLDYVVGKVLATEQNFIAAIASIATLAKDNAFESGRKAITKADIDSAIESVLPTPQSQITATTKPLKSAKRTRCNATAKPLPQSRRTVETLPIPSRERRPEMISV